MQGDVLGNFQTGWLHNQFLLLLLSSSAFKSYFTLLTVLFPYAMLPRRGEIQAYRDFKITLRPNPDEDVASVQPNSDKKEEEDDKERDDEEEDHDDDDDDDEDEFQHHSRFFRSLKTLVIHFTAKRALEQRCILLKNDDVKISLLYVERSPLRIPAGLWSRMEDMMKMLFPDDTATAEKALEILKGEAQKPRTRDSKLDKILADFKLVIDGTTVLLTGGMHCETVLATLGRYFKDILGNESYDKDNLIPISQVFLLFTCLLAI
jgi:hypothetical protein